MKRISYIFILAAVLSSCNAEFRRVQMSSDPDEKYDAAKILFLENEYAEASTLLEDIVSSYRGTAKAEQILYLLSESYIKLEDYYSAGQYFNTYIRNYPRGEYAQDVRFKIAYCHYMDSPDARLEQASTSLAIVAFTEYIDMYPNAANITEVRTYLHEMHDKLSYKGLLNAKLYNNLGLYGGNNYHAAVVTAEETLKNYPETSYKEELLFVILDAKFNEATYSVEEKGKERYSEVIDEYYRYTGEYSDGKYIRQANKILKEANKKIGITNK